MEIGARLETHRREGGHLSLAGSRRSQLLAQPIRANLFQSDRQGRAFHLVDRQ
jgi:hypothetical protein